MENSIVKIENKELVVGTWDLSIGLKIEHRYLKNLITKYMSDFEEFGVVGKRGFKEDICQVSNLTNNPKKDDDSLRLSVMNTSKKRGGQIEEYVINEEQYVLLGSYCKNTVEARDFKKKLTKEFFRMRKVLIKLTVQYQNEEWRLKRAEGKVERRLETDAIKEFIEYAKIQGSKSADKYYMIISKMENQSLVNLEILQQKFDNVRDMVEGFDLTALQIADKIVSVALREGVKLGMFYKEIYTMARDRVETFAITLGKTPLRLTKKAA